MTWVVTFYGKVPWFSKARSQTTTWLKRHDKSMVDHDGRQLVTDWWVAPGDVVEGRVEEGWWRR